MKVVFITGILPSGHYSQYITSGLIKTKKVNLLVYTDKNKKNLKVKNCGKIIPVWSKSPMFFIEILNRLKLDKPDIVHFQHEINMYGGIFTAAMFPLLIVACRLMSFKVVTTVHAAVYKSQVNSEFVVTFNQNPKFVKPSFLILFFNYVYKTISQFSNQIIVHTNLTKKILVEDYGVSPSKTKVIPAAIPSKKIFKGHKDPYFFYFGYMARRKGLGYALDGFKKFLKKFPNSPYKFVLAGGVIKGQESSLTEIMEMIKKSNLQKKVIYKGFLEEKEQDDLYNKAKAVVIPAILSMGSSGPLYHANSYGKCVLASKIGHYLEDIEDGKTGILVNNNAWAQAYEYVVKHSSVVRSIEKNTIKKAKIRSPLKTAQKYITMYQNIT